MFTLPKQTFEAQSILKLVGGVILAALIVTYVIFQARFLITGPQIVLEQEPDTNSNNRVIKLKGSAFNITHLWLNDRPIFTNENGDFEEDLVLENGYTIATLRAKDRYGRETQVVRSYFYTPASIIKN